MRARWIIPSFVHSYVTTNIATTIIAAATNTAAIITATTNAAAIIVVCGGERENKEIFEAFLSNNR